MARLRKVFDKAYRAAEKKIAAALRSGATELDLTGMKLTELPEAIGQLTGLRSLNFGNWLVTISPTSPLPSPNLSI